jgi:hypothetical protein
MKNKEKNKHTVEVINPLPSPKIPSEVLEAIGDLPVEVKHQPTSGTALVTIDGVLVEVKVHRRAKKAGESTDPMVGSGTWTVMRFDNPELKKHLDYKDIWKEVFFALGLNWNKRGGVCKKRELQREWTGTSPNVDCDCGECKERRENQQKMKKKSESVDMGELRGDDIPF